LPLWNRNAGNIEAAVSRRTQAEVSFSVAERELQRQVLEAALIYETKLREMENWRPDSIQHFKEAAEVADRHYRLGAVPISTYVELQKQYLDAVEGLLDTRKEALEAAARLELLAGLPPFVRTNGSKEEEKP
jgi:cobalt-zinc-cadmium efflux system outer membrane protein